MKMVFIYGPPAVGKATVARELANLTGYKYFINHQASDPVSSILDFDDDPSKFRSMANNVKNLILGKAADMGVHGIIMTFCYSRPDSDLNLNETLDLLRPKGADISFTRLYCEDQELFKRVQDPARKTMSVKKLSSISELQEALAKHNFKEEISYVKNLPIDNTLISPRKTAEKIINHHSLSIRQSSSLVLDKPNSYKWPKSQNTMGKTYLITGITGFAGPHLANLLIEKGHKVHGLVRASNGREQDIRDVVSDENMNKIKFVYGDLTSRESMTNVFKSERYDGVFHLAAQSHPPTSFIDPTGTFNANANGTINLVTALIEYSPTTKLMFCSTSEVYGRVPGETKEEQPINPINPYGVSKAAADLYVRERAVSEGFPFFVTRAFSHTGPRRGKNFSISSDAYQIARIVKGLQEPKIQVGKLESKRVVMDVRDCDAAYIALMESDFKPGEAYNVGGDKVYSMGELLDMMLEIKGLKGKVELIRDEKLVRKIGFGIQIPDSTKLREATGWKPQIPIEQTLRDLLAYWEAKVGQNR